MAPPPFAGSSAADDVGVPPNVPPWTKRLGRGVVSHPYGSPSPHEAHVKRRTVEWLTADHNSQHQLYAARGPERHHYAERRVCLNATMRVCLKFRLINIV